jgi:hypothetical protein
VRKTLMFDKKHAIRYASERLLGKKSVAIAAMKTRPQNLSSISSHLLADATFLSELERQARFHQVLRQVAGDRVLGLGLGTSGLEQDEWIDALVGAQTLYDDTLALSALFYILSQHTPLIKGGRSK